MTVVDLWRNPCNKTGERQLCQLPTLPGPRVRSRTHRVLVAVPGRRAGHPSDVSCVGRRFFRAHSWGVPVLCPGAVFDWESADDAVGPTAWLSVRLPCSPCEGRRRLRYRMPLQNPRATAGLGAPFGGVGSVGRQRFRAQGWYPFTLCPELSTQTSAREQSK